ncbi:mucin-associated surface protein (MASP), putative [Trypanosoma cruzi marinkellei]|uniref:Mucin-associated surface protein (MASP), putative n=1 Tax=Trypanosoma cruzi marinkellei TaxID=85056 RepID=K2MYU1_TRYCR|nr:mucin-associated surface protein (MASP), putative [Trypanosoma cruzi marinkellei]
MAMMMAGRVLLVCALCVLWCGAGGRCDGGGTAGIGNGGGGTPTESEQLETIPQGSADLNDASPGVKENVAPPSYPSKDDEDDDDDDDDDDEDGGTGDEEDAERGTEGKGGQGETVAVCSDSTKQNLSDVEQQTGQPIVSSGDISLSATQESNANLMQTAVTGKKETDENTTAGENALTTVNGRNTLPAGIAGGTPPPPKDGADSREQDGEDTTSEGNKNVPSPETAATPQSHRPKDAEVTGKDAKATTVTANTTDTTITQNSDGSTAASHTTSPLLFLFVVACAAAVVVAA